MGARLGALRRCHDDLGQPFWGSPVAAGIGVRIGIRWIGTAIDHREAMDAGVLLSALEVGANIASAFAPRCDVGLCGTRSRDVENPRGTSLVGTGRSIGHPSNGGALGGNDGRIRRIAAEAETPGLRASTYLADSLQQRAETGVATHTEGDGVPVDRFTAPMGRMSHQFQDLRRCRGLWTLRSSNTEGGAGP